jgi:hypothetical protein
VRCGGVTVPFGEQQFVVGLTFGGAGAALLVALWSASTKRPRRPVPLAGVLVGVAFALALARAISETGPWPLGPSRLPPGLALGLAGLAAAGLVAHRGQRTWLALPLAVPGALAVSAFGDLTGPPWLRWAVFAAIVLGGTQMEDFGRRHPARLTAVLLAVTAVALYYVVPDPDEAMVAVGTVLPIALVVAVIRGISFGPGGGFVAAAVVAWTAGAGGVGRQSAVIGGICCLGVLAGEPMVARLWRPRGRGLPPDPWVTEAATICTQVGAVFVAGRVGGTRLDGLRGTVLIGAAAIVAAGVAATWLANGRTPASTVAPVHRRRKR